MASLYVHVPYCEKKCIYCDFYSIENHASMDRFLAALDAEILSYAADFGSREPVETIFFGGGTPSLLAPSIIGGIISRFRTSFTVAPGCEITMEANPGTITPRVFEGYLEAGVNRLSLGVQSFHADELEFLGRIHTADEAERAVRDARQAGFTNMNCDLIFSLPGQTPARWRETLERALALGVEHISAYSLIVEEHTPLAAMVQRREVVPIDEASDAEIYTLTMDAMAASGYRHYEISNYARPGFECRHNTNYWNHTSYLGFGPSAHSFWRDSEFEGRRWWNERQITRYLARVDNSGRAVGGSEAIDKELMIEEEIFLGMRCGGLDLGRLQRVFGYDVEARMGAMLRDFEAGGFAVRRGPLLELTPKGFMMCDAMTERMVRT
jgi:oxygen-independent coproporphyrinogen III oxidase